MLAETKDGLALQDASDELRGDKEVVLSIHIYIYRERERD